MRHTGLANAFSFFFVLSIFHLLFWQFVAEALQHSDLVRSKVYSDIGWNKDHPVLLKIKLRFNPVSTRVRQGLTAATAVVEEYAGVVSCLLLSWVLTARVKKGLKPSCM